MTTPTPNYTLKHISERTRDDLLPIEILTTLQTSFELTNKGNGEGVSTLILCLIQDLLWFHSQKDSS